MVDDDGKTGPECLAEFGDGVTVIAQWETDGDALRLSVSEYRTASGTLVKPRNWRIVRDGEGRCRSELLP